MINTTFQITDEILDKCSTFAKDSVGTSSGKYASRNQFSISKITDDIRNGKIAEELVYRELVKFYPNLSSPDYEIYSKKNKSWDPDLKDLSIPLRIAVKSQEIKSEIAFGRSWVFQYGSGKNFDCDTGIFGGNKTEDTSHYVSFVSLNIPKKTGNLRAIVKVAWLHEKNLFMAMKKQNLQGNKVAVYYENLEPFGDELWQIKS